MTNSHKNSASVSAVELSTIQPIPLSERHGKPRDLFTIWFGSNIMLLTVITGSLAVSVFHLSFFWATVGVLIGNLAGGLFMALHSAQGPQLGVPQMVQTRGQFGSYGSVLVVALVVIMYIGFFASNLVLGGQSLHAIYQPLSTNAGIIAVALLSLIACAFGYNLIHAYTKIMSWVSGIILAAAFVWIIVVHGLPTDFLNRNGFNLSGFLGAISVAALWQLAYAPYVSDYSRYMPKDISEKSVFWCSYIGCVLGSFFPMILGILVSICIINGDLITAIVGMTGGLSSTVIIVFALGIAATNAMNLYCGVLCTLTLGQTFFARWSPLSGSRIATAIITVVLEVIIAVYGQDNFLVNYTNFILMLLYVLVPWTAINLVDYYLVAHGKYDIPSFFRRDGGIYGYYNLRAIFCYLLGIVVEIPFMSTEIYTGPASASLGGADISWLVGLLVVSPVYYLMSRTQTLTQTSACK
ncbi:cytosine permease [Erwinia sp. OLTSP20]|uniref:purine-cytosine permease family protein n=1 Tax=unclassified Erwinia TaxID=2622719 RepID=UPI000C55F4A0|nr:MULTISPECIES: cytosine permease [unclassified Erwinia]PIJ50417.1 cytosine permease [Erwinia sp. OAMSP11]PIJ72488.1 cytosine permease [Erwinia sp. OLSSP12]PIJ81726.1 cytosine permease [Erwinia sp. OLCASP19]PIJ84319.1 cytosine permease [Erwinia sp. OLMTSP26]PIJ86183.1 cytosine permease [Erwinia sp. OLMDSP33]